MLYCSVLYLADNEGGFEIVDVRAGKPLRAGASLHDKCVLAWLGGQRACTMGTKGWVGSG